MSRFDGTALVIEYGDDAFVRELATLLIDVAPAQLGAIRAAVDASDARAVGAAAHRLRGSVSAFHAHEAVETATRLEAMAMSGDLTGAEILGTSLARQVQELCDGAAAWLNTQA